MFSEKLLNELNKQVNYELYSAYLYMKMEAFFAEKSLNGFANFFKVQTTEERDHARMFFDFILRKGGKIALDTITKPEADFADILDVFKQALEHEKFVTSRIYELSDIAREEKEHATLSFLQWFVDEQVEEEETFQEIVDKLEFIGDNVHAILMLDAELAQRTYTPPAALTE